MSECIRRRSAVLQRGHDTDGINASPDECDCVQLGSRSHVFDVVHDSVFAGRPLSCTWNGIQYCFLIYPRRSLICYIFQFESNEAGEGIIGTEVRGMGTDIAIVSSMVFLAQFILSLCMGTIVTWSGTTTAVVSVASFLSFCGAISATQVMYLDL